MSRLAVLALAIASLASPALAQDPAPAPPPLPDPEDVRSADGFTVGLGAGFVPDYEGSDDYRLIPAAAIRGKVGNIAFTTRGLYLYVDALNARSGNVSFDLGPIVGARLNRSSKIKDDVVDLLPDRDTAFEVGAFGGINVSGITNPYDSLGFRLDLLRDTGDAHRSLVVSPSVNFATPLSRTLYVGASLSADFVADRFAEYYFSVTPADTIASGLPTFDADGGMKNWKVGLLANKALSGDLRRGWSIFGIGSYSRLVGDFADSPIVDIRGSAGQWFGAVGAAYSW